jgi:hypothetical protein
MSIKPICDKCKQELVDFGGILLSPPDKQNKVDKMHLCVACYQGIVSTFKK